MLLEKNNIQSTISSMGRGCWGLRINTGSRLSFTLLDLNGEGGRRNGMASLSIADPHFQAVIYPNSSHKVELDAESECYRLEIETLIEKIRVKWELPHVHVIVERGIPAHSGCGSKTTTLLAIARTHTALFGIDVPTSELTQLIGRGGTSGASVNLIDRGGYLVDGGHANPDDFHEDPHRYLLPSRYSKPAKKPPVLINLTFPDWPILLIVTRGIKLHSEVELNWFKQNVPIPQNEAHRIAHHVFLNLSTAVAESDYERFCKAVRSITYDQYFKGKQVALQPDIVQQMIQGAKNIPVIDALGLSVSGPMCFAFTRDPQAALKWCEEWRRKGAIESYYFTHARNRAYELSAAAKNELNI